MREEKEKCLEAFSLLTPNVSRLIDLFINRWVLPDGVALRGLRHREISILRGVENPLFCSWLRPPVQLHPARIQDENARA